MTDYIRIPQKKPETLQHYFILEDFFSRYAPLSPQDIYAWLWEGEFGLRKEERLTKNLIRLNKDIQKAYSLGMESSPDKEEKTEPENMKEEPCEYLGLAEKFLRVNLLPYFEAKCPLKRLLKLHNSLKNYKANRFRFKQNWKFLKEICIEEKAMPSSSFDSFERNIDFYLMPEIYYTQTFLQKYPPSYYIVPQSPFFQFFPEYKLPRA